jgi:hypothetical protein
MASGWSSNAPARRLSPKIGISMLYTIAVIMILLWLLGLISSYTMGGFIHILLILAIIMVVLDLIQRRPSS